MDLFELSGQSEDHYAYKNLAASNSARHYGFLNSMINEHDTSRPCNVRIKAIKIILMN